VDKPDCPESDRLSRRLAHGGTHYLIHDRDSLFTEEFLSTLAAAGVESVKLPPRSPNLNAHAERFVRSIKGGCLERLVLFGESSLRTAVQNFIAHYLSERNHQGLGNLLICPEPDHVTNTGAVQRRERLGGMLNYYYRAAA
jgi:transposase InsO family protein